MTEETSRHQALMDQAYSRFSPNYSLEEFWDQLTPIEAVVVHTGNLNYQVGNGGFIQWAENGYIKAFHEVLPILKKIGTQAALQAYDLTQEFGRAFLSMEEQKFRRGYYYEEDDEDGDWEMVYALSNRLSDQFYKIDEQFLVDVEEYIRKVEANENPGS